MSDLGEREPLLTLREATVARGGKVILDHVSLNVSVGEHCAIVGPNGSGKSSLLRLITRQWYPLARGDGLAPIELFGRARWDVFSLRKMLGIVSPDLHQEFAVDSERSGLEWVLSGFFASHGLALHSVVTEQMRAAAWDALAQADAVPLAAVPLREMSTGEARRILIARALAHSPRALILDEPTAGLDMAAAQGFLRTVRRLAQAGTTIVLVTHHVDEIVPEVGRVVLLRAGRVFFDGLPADALSSARLSALFDVPISVTRSADGTHAFVGAS